MQAEGRLGALAVQVWYFPEEEESSWPELPARVTCPQDLPCILTPPSTRGGGSLVLVPIASTDLASGPLHV